MLGKALTTAAAGNAAGEALYVEEVFSTYLYDGTSATQTITNGVDLDGEGGLVWIKPRTSANNHKLVDTERGNTKEIESNTTSAESTRTNGITSFNSNGFTLGTSPSYNDATPATDYVSWTFRKAPKFFDVMTVSVPSASYVADAITVDHSLNAIPGMVIVKDTAQASNWWVWHKDLTGNNYLKLHLTDAIQDFGVDWINVTDTQVKLHGWFAGNQYASGDLVIYVFAHNDGDGEFGEDADQDIIKCGSYTGTGSAQTLNLGFEAQWVLIKQSSGANDWNIWDNMRGLTVGGGTDAYLQPNTADAEDGSGAYDFLSPDATGVIVDPGSNGYNFVNTSGQTYIYIAIRRGPMKTPESGTEVFAQDYRHNATPAYTSNFPVDWAMQKRETGTDTRVATRMLGDKYLNANTTGAEATLSTITWDYNDGMESHTSDQTDKWQWMFRRAPGFFDVVAYTGNGTAGRTVSHNLGVAPELMIVICRNPGGEYSPVYVAPLGNTTECFLQLANASQSTVGGDEAWNSTTPTSSVFSVSGNNRVNASGRTYIAYLFATLPGVSKVGSYTGNGTSQTIDCGFSAGARFVLIKRTDSTGDWHIYDSERGIVAGNDPRLEINTTDAEDTGSDDIDPVSSGFSVTSNADVNTNTAEYIFLAIA